MNAIEFNNISKQYRLGLVSSRTISHDLNRWWQTSVLHREDPYLKIGDVNDRSKQAESEYVWALRNIDFSVEQGDIVGIIGKNGAGKSTLLKILSRITAPTTGTIKARGRIASLLEVGTGFHGELTGRENIYMNGTIIGMTKCEIDRKLDEIVAFSGVERYIDTPVKRYSSGMMVRLGFAVAAHLEQEILVVDEVLAVGDAEFQKKAIGKMQEVSSSGGRTVLFVSHNMASLKQLCTSGVLLEDGAVTYQGSIHDCIDTYISEENDAFKAHSIISRKNRNGELSKDLEITEAFMLNDNVQSVATNELLKFRLKVNVNNQSVKNFTVGLMINDSTDTRIGSYVSSIYSVPNKSSFTIDVELDHHNLARGRYNVGFNVGLKDLSRGLRDYDVVHDVLSFNVEYLDYTTKTPIVLWQSQWGRINFRDAKVTISI